MYLRLKAKNSDHFEYRVAIGDTKLAKWRHPSLLRKGGVNNWEAQIDLQLLEVGDSLGSETYVRRRLFREA